MHAIWKLCFPLLLATGCGKDAATTSTQGEDSGGTVTVLSGGTQPTYSLCSTSLTKKEFVRLMNGNLVFVADATQHGKSAAEAITQLVTMLVVNGIDPEKLADYSFDFTDGDYTFKSGNEGYTFSLYFVADFGAFKSGDKIPYNVFDYHSYIKNISVAILPTPSVTYDHGELFDLVDGSITTSGVSLSGLKVAFHLKTELINFALNSRSIYHGQSPRDEDTLLWSMTTTPLVLPRVKEQFDAGGFGLTFDGTVYDSKYYDVKQTYGVSPAFIKSDATGYYWELTYQSLVEKTGLTVYQTGLASERQDNVTNYFCDESLATPIGVARHAPDLESGVFTFTDGTTVAYGLVGF